MSGPREPTVAVAPEEKLAHKLAAMVRLMEIADKSEEIVIYSSFGSLSEPDRGTTPPVADAVSSGFKTVYCFECGVHGWKAAG